MLQLQDAVQGRFLFACAGRSPLPLSGRAPGSVKGKAGNTALETSENLTIKQERANCNL